MLLTVDIGTSNFKSAIWDYDGNLLSFSAFPLSTDEHDCSVWLKAFESCCRKLGNLSNVDAIVISGNGPTLVPVMGNPSIENGCLSVPAQNARLWIERKADKFQERVSEIMGSFVDSGFFLPKILSIKHEENDLYKRVKFFLGCPEYLAFALTGEARSVFPSQGFDRWFWNDEILKKLDLDSDKFPPFISPGEIIGNIDSRAAVLFGIKKDIPVISGGPDFFAAILGCGVTQPSSACDRCGSSEGINLCTQNRIDDQRLMSYGHPVKPYWNLSGIINTTGRAVKWAGDILGIPDYADFFSLAQKSEAGSGGLLFLPYLAGERAPVWDSSIRALWYGISLSSTKSEFASSVIEGICFAIKDVVSVMEETGEKVNHLRVTGGMAGNAFFNQKKADITGKKILEPVHKEAELLGCAIIGACYLGKYKSFKEAVCAMVNIEKIYEPNPENAAIYNSLFEKYIALRQRH